MLYRVAYQYPDGSLGSMRVGLPMPLLDARLAASRGNAVQGKPLEDEGQYVVIEADSEKVVP